MYILFTHEKTTSAKMSYSIFAEVVFYILGSIILKAAPFGMALKASI